MNIIYEISTSLPAFLIAIVFHEAAHAWMADRFGDTTAKMAGRLTLNPLVHYDLIGTIVFPLIGAMMGGIMFGWAKPVPVNTRRFKNIRSGIFWVSFAGPLMNIALMFVSAFFLAILITKIPPDFSYFSVIGEMLKKSVVINILLATFNLIPFPPLDGSKMVSATLSYERARWFEDLERFSIVFVLVLLLTPVLNYIMTPALMFSNLIVNVFIHLLSH